MQDLPKHVLPAVAATLARWHEMVARKDLGGLDALVHPDVVFRSPASHSVYRTPAAICQALSTVVQVFEDFTYHRQLASDDGLDVMLEFSANVGDKAVKGIDLIRLDEAGRIVDFEVMVRPLSGLQALAATMTERMGDKLQPFRGKA